MSKHSHKWVGLVLVTGLAIVVGLLMLPPSPKPTVTIRSVEVVPEPNGETTTLHVLTRYTNSGCSQTLLARFLINTRPTPSIALPQLQGPTILPLGLNEIEETIGLDFLLTEGHWHMFSVASCYVNGEPVPSATVAPTALFSIAAQ